MRTRSARFFVMLVHLMGVSQFHSLYNNKGMHQHQQHDATSCNTTAIMSRDNHNLCDVWIQEATAGLCLDATGYLLECGDATLWNVRPYQPPLQLGLFGLHQPQEDSAATARRIWTLRQDNKCWVAATSARNRTGGRSVQLQLKPCWKHRVSKAWHFREDGSVESWSQRGKCLWAVAEDSTHNHKLALTLAGCELQELLYHTKVHVSLVRYGGITTNDGASATSTSLRASHVATEQGESSQSAVSLLSQSQSPSPVEVMSPFTGEPDKTSSSPPSNRGDVAHSHARQPMNKKKTMKQPPNKLPLAFFQNSHPLLLLNVPKQQKPSTTTSTTRATPDTPSLVFESRKIHVHPYIAASKNERWTDPQTGLEYFTDLTLYLGRNRKEHGRHTLMGVGQYYKFMMKVYGVAYYVSKRDTLSSPSMEAFATLSREELRHRPDFYQLLRTQTSSHTMERTLMLKTNMQLSAETMRSSLGADWKMLTEEAKSTLISSSMEPRPADADMLALIASPDNPSKCSCASVAPPEYKADPTCCARGTELAFTWLKSGDLEVRLNGRLMDVFPRPDIAEGIFFEYLRYDDPISTELRDNVVKGFPFLLAPLAQVKGVNFGQQQEKSNKAATGNPMFRARTLFADSATSGATLMNAVALYAFTGTMSNAAHAAKSLSDAANNIKKEMYERTDGFLAQAASVHQLMTRLLLKDNDSAIVGIVSEWVTANITPSEQELKVFRKDSLGRAFGYPLSRWFSETYQEPDEIGPLKVVPTMTTPRRIFLAFVHVYLLLLFIVSFPDSYNITRTKLVTQKGSMVSKDFSDSESSDDASDVAIKRSSSDASISTNGGSAHFRRRISESKTAMVGGARRRLVFHKNASADSLLDESSSRSSGRLKKKSISYFM